MESYSIDYAISSGKPHSLKAYILAKREWQKKPYNPEEDLEKLTDKLEALLPKDKQTSEGRLVTLIILEIGQEDKIKGK
jgi:hypothetical protein